MPRRKHQKTSAAPAPVDPAHYDGKQHYPAAVYGKLADGSVVSRLVETPEHHEQVLAEGRKTGVSWMASPADHGLETCPSGVPVDTAQVGKVA